MALNGFLDIAHFLKSVRRFDAVAHSEATFQSALSDRLRLLQLSEQAYLDELQVRPGEINILLSQMLQPRSLFEETGLWELLRDQVVPALIKLDGPIRIWCVSCANGLDAYALAILFVEALGPDVFAERVKIFATNADDAQLSLARTGIYADSDLVNFDTETVRKHFVLQGGNQYAFRSDLRRMLIFGKHKFLQDAPISRMSLVVCRYQLALQDIENQQKTLTRLLFSLENGGFALVGAGETIPAGHGFKPTQQRLPLYVKSARNKAAFGDTPPPEALISSSKLSLLEESAFDICGPAQIVVDTFGILTRANQRARTIFGVTHGDLGKPLQDLEISYRPLELRSLIDRVAREGEPVKIPHVMKLTASGPVHFEVLLEALVDNGRVVGTSVQYVDVSRRQDLSMQVNVLNEQLHAANEELHSAHEELVTTNEELQSTNEELETTNEELQSTNEELETMNEELRSTNNALDSSNAAQRAITERLEADSLFLNSVVDSIQSSIIVLSANYEVVVWSQGATNMWGLRSDEVIGQNFFGLDIGFPADSLKKPLRSLHADDRIVVQTDALNRRGKKIRCNVIANALSSSSQQGFLLMITECGAAHD